MKINFLLSYLIPILIFIMVRMHFSLRYLVFIPILIMGFHFFAGMTVFFLGVSLSIALILLSLKSEKLPTSLQPLCISLREHLPFASDVSIYLPSKIKGFPRRCKNIQNPEQAQKEAKGMLEPLLGIDEALNGIQTLVDNAKAAHKHGQVGFGIHAPALLIVISGPAGTGKTHISNALALLFYGSHAIPTPTSFLLGKRKLLALDPQRLFDDLVGIHASGVIILDDADWMLSPSGQYTHKPIDEIGPELAEYVANQPNNFVVVVNGSQEQMEEMFGAGDHKKWLRSFQITQIHTKHLNDENLLTILQDLLYQKGWTLSDDANSSVQKLLRQLREENLQTFDNAHTVSHLADKLITLKSQQNSAETEHVITLNDVERLSEL